MPTIDLTEYPMLIPTTLGGMRERWCVYGHTLVSPPEAFPTFIGISKLKDVFSHRDAYMNSEWIKKVKDDTPLLVSVLALADQRYEAETFMRSYFEKNGKPYCNKFGHMIGHQKGIVTCVTGPNAGQHYGTATEAALKNGISQGAMSSHLNGRPAYATVHGMTFKRGM